MPENEEQQASLVFVDRPADRAGDIPVNSFDVNPDRRNPDDDTRRVQQVRAAVRAANALDVDETTYNIERTLNCLGNLEIATEGRYDDKIAEIRKAVREIQQAEKERDRS